MTSSLTVRSPRRIARLPLHSAAPLALLLLAASSTSAAAQHSAVASVEVFAMVVARPVTQLSTKGAPTVRAVSGGVVVSQTMALTSNVDSQTLEAVLAQPDEAASAEDVRVSVACGGSAGRCRLSGGVTPAISIDVKVEGLSSAEVASAIAAPSSFAARVTYRLVRGEGT